MTGGGGFIGGQLCKGLVERGYSVTAFDVHYLDKDQDDSVQRIQGDIRDSKVVKEAVAQSKADVVFHIASFGMSGRDQLNRELIEAVNIRGTRNVIEACVEHGASRLVYTSTYNVVFGGQEIRNGDESTISYLPLDKHVDHYSRTKCIAEQEVIAADGREVEGGAKLMTCALRCAGIYGEGEQRHLPRIVSYMERGLFKFTYGAEDSLVEFLHADNFVQAHIKAAEACCLPDSPVPGQAYFISDGKPVNNFQFFRPLLEALGYTYPRIKIPISLIYFIAFLTEIVHGFVGRYIYNFQPLLTRAEVFKTGVTHYFSMKKAKRDFGYEPEPRTLDGVIQWFKERGHGVTSKKPVGRSTVTSVLFYLALAVVVVMLVFSALPVAGSCALAIGIFP